MLTLRSYQQESIDSAFNYWLEGNRGNPLIDLATGLGKSLVVAFFAKRFLEAYPTARIMCVVHVRELVKQNFEELLKVWPDAPVGIYSAGLGQRDTHHRMTYASIQSIYKKPDAFAPRQLIMIDEAHLVPGSGDGMYRSFLEGLQAHYPGVKVLGLTATPYRLDSGRLDSGEDRIFDEIVYKYGIGEGTRDGYLCPLTARLGKVEINVDGVTKRGGEFVPSALNHAANKADIVGAACDDIIERGADRRSWLMFCSGVDHAHAVAEALRERGISAATVTGATPANERDSIIDDFKKGRIRALTNAQVLTAGFNAPELDLIALLRPTLSAGLYTQMLGRGTRVSKSVDLQAYSTAEARVAAIAGSSKPNCLVLDFAGNVRRHGPVDAIHVTDPQKREKGEDETGRVDADEVNAKVCPECEALLYINARKCPDCGHEFGEPKHETHAEDIAVMTREMVEEWVPVTSWRASAWHKGGDPTAVPTMRVDLLAGVMEYPEWIGFEHRGHARSRAAKWWQSHGGDLPVPESIDEALERFPELTPPLRVTLIRDGRYYKINQRQFEEIKA